MEKGSEKPKAVVLLSGGMDSCVCTAIAIQAHGAERVALLHAGYGQRTQKRERQAFESIADFYHVQQRLVVQLDHFRAIGGSALTDGSIAVFRFNALTIETRSLPTLARCYPRSFYVDHSHGPVLAPAT